MSDSEPESKSNKGNNTHKVKRKSNISGESDSPGIKLHLRNNSGTPQNPQKLRKMDTPSKSAKQLQAMYGAEGRSMEMFLECGSTTVNADANSDESETDNEVSLKNMTAEVGTGSENVTSKDRWVFKGRDGQMQSDSTSDNKRNKTTQNSQSKSKMEKTEQAALKEIQVLKGKMEGAKEGSIEKMRLEMHLDIKKDNLEVMGKMDKVSVNTDTFQHEVSKLKQDQISLQAWVKMSEDS